MIETENYGLQQFEGTDKFDYRVINENFRKLDEKVAPSGYGLGEKTSPLLADCNDAIRNGWYKTGDNTLNLPVHQGTTVSYSDIFVLTTGTRIWQIMYTHTPSGLIFVDSQLIRYSYDSGNTWGEWAWVNPPMVLGVEYRTTERHEGEVVCAKRIAFTTTESAGNASGHADFVISHGIQNFKQLVRISGRSTTDSRTIYQLPVYTSAGGVTSIHVVGTSGILLRAINDVWIAGSVFYFDLYYTKTA